MYPECLYYQVEQEPCQHRELHLLNKAQKSRKQPTPLSRDTCTFSPFWKRTPAYFYDRKVAEHLGTLRIVIGFRRSCIAGFHRFSSGIDRHSDLYIVGTAQLTIFVASGNPPHTCLLQSSAISTTENFIIFIIPKFSFLSQNVVAIWYE